MRKLFLLSALLIAGSAHAQSLDDVVSNVMKEYGGEAAWKKVLHVHAYGTVVPAMRKGDGKMKRVWGKPDRLLIEIQYPTEREVRFIEGDHGTRNDKEVTGASLDGMKLQVARLALPYLLVEKRASLHDLGTKDGIRSIEIPLPASLTLTVSIDTKTWHIVRTSGKASGLEFVTDYSDFRRVGPLLFPFAETGTAQGMPTATIKIDTVLFNDLSAPVLPGTQ